MTFLWQTYEEQIWFFYQQCLVIYVYFHLISIAATFLSCLETEWKADCNFCSPLWKGSIQSNSRKIYKKNITFVITRLPSSWYISGTMSIKKWRNVSFVGIKTQYFKKIDKNKFRPSEIVFEITQKILIFSKKVDPLGSFMGPFIF